MRCQRGNPSPSALGIIDTLASKRLPQHHAAPWQRLQTKRDKELSSHSKPTNADRQQKNAWLPQHRQVHRGEIHAKFLGADGAHREVKENLRDDDKVSMSPEESHASLPK